MDTKPSPSKGRLWGEAVGTSLIYFIALVIVPVVGFLGYISFASATGQSVDPQDIVLASKVTFLSLPIVSILVLLFTNYLLKKRDVSWSSIGLKIPQKKGTTLLLGLGVFLVAALFSYLVNTGMSSLGYEQDLTAFNFLQGDFVMYLWLITVISWFSAGFTEEVVFRGFIMGNLAAALGDTDRAWIIAAVLQALIFGIFHAYQGLNGIAATGTIALVFGLFYYKLRSLWPLIIAHGVLDVVGISALYFGAEATI